MAGPDIADLLVAGSFDPVGVVARSLDDPWVAAVAALGVEGWLAGDVGHDRGAEVVPLGGKAAGPMARRTMRTVRVNLTRSGSMSASVAARQIRALIA